MQLPILVSLPVSHCLLPSLRHCFILLHLCCDLHVVANFLLAYTYLRPFSLPLILPSLPFSHTPTLCPSVPPPSPLPPSLSPTLPPPSSLTHSHLPPSLPPPLPPSLTPPLVSVHAASSPHTLPLTDFLNSLDLPSHDALLKDLSTLYRLARYEDGVSWLYTSPVGSKVNLLLSFLKVKG